MTALHVGIVVGNRLVTLATVSVYGLFFSLRIQNLEIPNVVSFTFRVTR